MKLERYRQNKTVELPTGVIVRQKWSNEKKKYILTVQKKIDNYGHFKNN